MFRRPAKNTAGKRIVLGNDPNESDPESTGHVQEDDDTGPSSNSSGAPATIDRKIVQTRLLSFQDFDDEDQEEKEVFKVKKGNGPLDVVAPGEFRTTAAATKNSRRPHCRSNPRSTPQIPSPLTPKVNASFVAMVGGDDNTSLSLASPEDDGLESIRKALDCMRILEATKPHEKRHISEKPAVYQKHGSSEDKEWEVNQLSKGLTKLQLEQISPLTRSRMISLDDYYYDVMHLNPLEVEIENAEIEKILTGEALRSCSIHKDKIIGGILHEIDKHKHRILIGDKRKKLGVLDIKLANVKEERALLEKEMALLSARFLRIQQKPFYLIDLVDCLRHKSENISKIENSMIDLMRTNAKYFAEKRSSNVKRQYEEIVQSLSNKTKGQHTETSEQDDIDSDQHQNSNEEYKAKMEVVMQQAKEVFSDVRKEFSNIESVLEFFGTWHAHDPKLFKLSSASSHLPKLIIPFIRLETLSWDPLASSNVTEREEQLNFMSEFAWYKSLQSASFLNRKARHSHIACLVNRILAPWVERVIEAQFDSFSVKHNKSLLNVVKAIQDTKQDSSQSIKKILSIVLAKFRQSVDNAVFIPVFTSEALQAESVTAFAHRQFGSSLKLFKNMTPWFGVLEDSELRRIAMDGLLARYLLLGIRISPNIGISAERAKKIADVIPNDWLTTTTKHNEAAGGPSIKLFISSLTVLRNQAHAAQIQDEDLNQSISETLKRLNLEHTERAQKEICLAGRNRKQS